jgi:amidophosphoribosyltransferase
MNENKEKCGVMAYIGKEEYTVEYLLNNLNNIQHRGRESFGICFKKWNTLSDYETHLFLDLITKAKIKMSRDFLEQKTQMSLLHTRYSTSGEKDNGTRNSMPITSNHINESIGSFTLAFNGNIPFDKKYLELEELKDHKETLLKNYVDTKMIVEFIKNCNVSTIEQVLIKFVDTFPRAYSLVVINNNKLFVMKDRYGLKPLCIGKMGKNNYCVASESICLLENYKYYGEINGGNILRITDSGINEIYKFSNSKISSCLFEYIYFMKDKSKSYYSKNNNTSVASIRYKFGEKLAEFENIDNFKNDGIIVIGVPSTGKSSAIGFAQKLKLPLLDGLVKNPKSNRTFILGSDRERNKAANEKYLIDHNIVNNRDIFLIDDSIVRGITMKNIIIKLRENGAKKIHLRVSSPEITGICYYGVDIPSKEELIANKLNIEEMTKEFNVDSLRYLDLKDMLSVFPKNVRNNFCSGCIDGNYNYNKDIEDL